MNGRTFHILGIPLRSGSLVPGTENDALAYRDADISGRLQLAGSAALDEGDLAVPSYLPHHTVPPVAIGQARELFGICSRVAYSRGLVSPVACRY
jgi:hypothetical protein